MHVGATAARTLRIIARVGDQALWRWAISGRPLRSGGAAAVLQAANASYANTGYVGIPVLLATFGEVGLAGEVRPAPRGQERLKEAAKLGFSVALVPKANAPKRPIEGLTVHAVERVEEAMDVVRGL